jgi:hypothetical protein
MLTEIEQFLLKVRSEAVNAVNNSDVEDLEFLNERLTKLGLRPISHDEPRTSKTFEVKITAPVEFVFNENRGNLDEAVAEALKYAGFNYQEGDLDYGNVVAVGEPSPKIQVRLRSNWRDLDTEFVDLETYRATHPEDNTGIVAVPDGVSLADLKRMTAIFLMEIKNNEALCFSGIYAVQSRLDLPQPKVFTFDVPVQGTTRVDVWGVDEDQAKSQIAESLGGTFQATGDPVFVG